MLYALFSGGTPFDRRRNLVFVGAAVALAAGLVVLVADFEGSPSSGAGLDRGGGPRRVGRGRGYSRAGGDDMIPPGAVRRPQTGAERGAI